METKINQKMKKSSYKSGKLLLFTAILICSFSLSAQEVTKEYHKEYKADKNTTLDVSNRYGDVVITSWEKDQVVIDVKVTVDIPGKDRAEKLLSLIDVQFSEGTNLITAKTVIDDRFNFSGWGFNRKFSIDYTIKMPAVSNLTLANKYGNTDIDELKGLVNLDIKYGDLSVVKFARTDEKPLNKLTLAYGKGSIEEAGWLDVYVRYCGSLEINKCKALLLDSRYSKVKIGETSSLVGESKYDNIGIDKINNMVLVTGYTTINVGELAKKLDFQGSYASFTVDEIPAGFESLKVDVRYMGVRLGISGSANYKIEGESSYGGIKLDEERFKYQKHIVENNSTELSGVVGNEASPASSVKLSASYGTIKLY
jgi:hypothetical protein